MGIYDSLLKNKGDLIKSTDWNSLVNAIEGSTSWERTGEGTVMKIAATSTSSLLSNIGFYRNGLAGAQTGWVGMQPSRNIFECRANEAEMYIGSQTNRTSIMAYNWSNQLLIEQNLSTFTKPLKIETVNPTLNTGFQAKSNTFLGAFVRLSNTHATENSDYGIYARNNSLIFSKMQNADSVYSDTVMSVNDGQLAFVRGANTLNSWDIIKLQGNSTTTGGQVIGFYANSTATGSRTGWLGYRNSSLDLTLNNSNSGSDLLLETTGGGKIKLQGRAVSIQSTAPTSPAVGDIWVMI